MHHYHTRCWCSRPRASAHSAKPAREVRVGGLMPQWQAGRHWSSSPSPTGLSWPRAEGWGSLGSQGRGLPLSVAVGHRCTLGIHRTSRLGPPDSTQETCPFCLLSAGTSEALESPHTISTPSCVWYVPLPLPTPGQPLLVLLISSGTTSSVKPSSVPSLQGCWWPSGLKHSPFPTAL